MLEEVHTDPIAQSDRETCGKECGPEVEVSEDHTENEQKDQPRCPSTEVG
jgi:hypothetical protein